MCRFSTTIACFAAMGVILAQSTKNPIRLAAEALAADQIHTLQFSASGDSFTVGQNYSPNDPWPRVPVKSFAALINYETGSMRLDMLRELGPTMPRGGGVPFSGELHQIQAVGGKYAWNEPAKPGPPPGGAAPATPCTIPEVGGTGPAGPAFENHDLCLLILWMTPHGFIKAAIANNATASERNGGAEISFVLDGKYKMTGTINAQNQIERVRTWVAQSIVGDMPIEMEYSGYKHFGSVLFPSHIVQKQDGLPSFDLTVTSVNTNPAADIRMPDHIRSAQKPLTTVNSEKVADGVYFLSGGTHHSLTIEMKDYIVLVDTPNGEDRASAVIAKTKELIPRKPIRYVVAMHHHWDHLGGIRTAIDEGATIVSHETNRKLLERAAIAPHTINPDRLSNSRRPLNLELVGSERELSDGNRTIKLYTMTGFDHTGDMLLVYLPKERILAEADAYTPPDPPGTPLIPPKVPYARALYDNIRRLHIDVQVIVPFHGSRTADLQELKRQCEIQKSY
jgi:glyoxylase-like metal-dependent hydrolase (beta-lactamase superfamily II)